ncbi:MAG: TonB-dependent receptor [Acidobacteriaceae bacterium]
MNYRIGVLLLILSSISPSIVYGQLTSATVSGTVTDSAGASIPGAMVTATDDMTGAVSHAETNAQGSYVVTGLAPDTYRLVFSKDGFSSYQQYGLTITVSQRATVNAVLHVGSVSQSVTVKAASAMLNFQSPTISTTIDTKMTVQLPLNGRDVLQLMQLAPDVGPTAVVSYQQNASRPDQANNFVGASGGRGDSTSYYLDGALNEDALTQIANVYPDPDAIQEFSFATSTFSAKFSGRGGGVMNAVTRGGTNQLHGVLFEFVRNSALNGRTYFSPVQDNLVRNQFGGTLGGPFRKDKIFGFFSYQGTRITQNPINSAIVLTAAQRAGDFSADKKQLVDPSTRKPFPGNQVPTTRFDPIAKKVLAIVPVGAPSTGIVQYLSRFVQNDDQFVARGDEVINQNLRIYASYIHDGLQEPSTSIPGNLLTATTNSTWLSQFGVVNTTYIFSPSLTTTFVTSFSRRSNLSTSPPGFTDWTGFGAKIPDLAPPGRSSFNLLVKNYFSKDWAGSYAIPATEGGVGNQWTWVRSNHTLEFGGDILRSKVVKNQDHLGDGYPVFSNQLSGDNALDFLLGKPSTFTQIASVYIVPTRTLPALYFIDTWKATPRSTLTLGVRWNPFVPVFESAYHEEAIFSPSAYAANIHSSRYPTLPKGLLLAGDPGVPSRVIDSDYYLFDPRVGFALDIFGNGMTSLRGGLGVYQDQMTANTINPNFSPFNTNVLFTNPASIDNPYQGQIDPFPLPRGPAPQNTPFQIPEQANPFTRGMKPPTIQQWNLTLEQQVFHSSVFRIAYEGGASYHLFGSVEGNAAVYNPQKTLQQNLANYNIRRPMGANFQGLALGRDVGRANFNALVVSMQKQTTHGVTFLTGYRWSRCMDESEESFFDRDAYSTPDPSHDYGPCSFNVKNQVKGVHGMGAPINKLRLGICE